MTGWEGTALHSPVSGAVLMPDTGYSLAAAGERWPVVEGIAFLRADRRPLADEALAALECGRGDEALALLLGDQDNWARSAPPDIAARRRLVAEADELSFRSAMDLLAFGPVGTYFAHRWSDPTFLSGLALAQAHGPLGSVLELACGAGHFLREFARAGAAVTGADIVFAKLWLTRRYVAPAARLICFDAAEPWPFAAGSFDTVFCHDAFYFLPDKPRVAGEMRRVGARALVGHAHNALTDNLSSGEPLPPSGYAALFGDTVMYDDRELTAALVEAREPRAGTPGELAEAPAISWATGRTMVHPVSGGVAMPSEGTLLRRNPLYSNGTIHWPSSRYETEYAGLATYPVRAEGPEAALAGADAIIDDLARRRVLLDLPARW